MKTYKILAINPGSASVKIALYENNKLIYEESIKNTMSELTDVHDLNSTIPSKINSILLSLEKHNIALESIDAFCGRAGGLTSLKGGVYTINDKVLEHARIGYSLKHASNLGVQIAYQLAQKNNKPSYTVNPVTVDELQDISRITGIKGIYKKCIFHSLNQKEVAYQYAKSTNKKYEDLNLIVVHLGSGITIGAHKKGKVVDVNNALEGDGPFTTNRTGSVTATNLIDLCFSGKYTKDELYNLVTKSGGLISLLGTNDIREVVSLIENGNEYAKLVLDAMIYQIGKQVGAMSINFGKNLDGIILTGAIAYSEYFISRLKKYIEFLGNVTVIPGEKEMQALVNGTLRVLNNEEKALTYTGIPVELKYE